MSERERIIKLWFDMWLEAKDMGIENIFCQDAVYIESWGPEYHSSAAIKHWFNEWNTRGRVVQWTIKQFIHKDWQTVVEWYFANQMNNSSQEIFEGLSLVKWTTDNHIYFLQEYGCNINRYDPYTNNNSVKVYSQQARWF